MFGLINIKLIKVLFLLTFVMYLTKFDSKAQLESAKWIFGHGAGVDFTSGQPAAFTGSKIKTSEGCSTVSDNAGNLLFYTDGVKIWNKNNEIMSNGSNLKGNFSSTQSAIIVPLPENKTIYYVFTLDRESDKGGFCYSIVDISKEQGLGDVVLKNQTISQNCAEKILAVRHSNKKDIWIIVHESGTNVFMAYLLTKNGLSLKPVTSATGISYQKLVYNTIGYFKISPDKRKIASAIMGEKLVQIFDFDAQTGFISNPIDLKFKTESSPYGLEFSPNSKVLYIGSTLKGIIFQANLNTNNQQAIQESVCIVGKSTGNKGFGALQLGINNNIYIAEYESNYLSTIQNPDSIGMKCSFITNSIFLKDKTCMLGLPTFFHEFVKPVRFSKIARSIDKNIELNQKYVFNSIYFDFNKTALKKSATNELQLLFEYLNQNKKVNIEITGHTDSIGSLHYNEKLSLNRAKKIGKLLNQKGICTSRMTFSGKGYCEPISRNTEENGRKQNRRVEFILKETQPEN